jgi:hypothetical protein
MSAEFRQVQPDHCNGTVVSEESESDLVGDITAGDDDVTEEATTGIDVISLGLDEEGGRTDEEEDEIEDAMHSFGDAQNVDREVCERDSLQIDDGDAIPCHIGGLIICRIFCRKCQFKLGLSLLTVDFRHCEELAVGYVCH